MKFSSLKGSSMREGMMISQGLAHSTTSTCMVEPKHEMSGLRQKRQDRRVKQGPDDK